MRKTSMINLCIVGSGDVVRDRHAAILNELSDRIHVKCIVSKRQTAVNAVQEILGYSVLRVETLDEALKLGINAALIAITPISTMDVATYLTRFKIPLYVEKPISHDVITAAKFIEEVTKLSLPVIVGENFQNQERFSIAKSMIQSCAHIRLTDIFIKDTLRRGLRTNLRSDDALFAEHIVHIISSIRAITDRSIETILKCSKRSVGSISEYIIQCLLENGSKVEIQLNITNTWSEDRYSLIFNDADIKLSHTYNYGTKKYTDTIEHWHGSEELVGVVSLPDAICGMRVCWDEFIDLVQSESIKYSPTLIKALNDIQVREAVLLSLSQGYSVPVVKLAL